MKAKQIKQSILAILMIAVLMVGTSTVSAGAATQKTYLDDMLYSEIISYSDENTFSSFAGADYFNNSCERAMLFHIKYAWDSYPDEIRNAEKSSYSIKYELNGNYNNFICGLTHKDNYMHNTVIEIYGDQSLLFSLGMEDETPYKDIDIPVKGIEEITLKFSYPIGSYVLSSDGYIIFDNAYFTSEGTTPEPTTTVEPTKKPEPTTTVEPTTKPEPATTVAPTTSKPVVIPTTAPASTATKATSSTEKTTTKVKPTASTNATSKVSSPDTSGKTSIGLKGNIRNDNGTIKTGDVSIAVIVLLLISSLAAGGFAFYRRKIK